MLYPSRRIWDKCWQCKSEPSCVCVLLDVCVCECTQPLVRPLPSSQERVVIPRLPVRSPAPAESVLLNVLEQEAEPLMRSQCKNVPMRHTWWSALSCRQAGEPLSCISAHVVITCAEMQRSQRARFSAGGSDWGSLHLKYQSHFDDPHS